MPRVQAPLKKAKARSCASNTISWRLARIGPHEQHPAVAQPDMRDLHGHRRAVDQHDLVAPVELVGLARRKAQRHIGFRRRRPALDAPLLGVAPDRVVAALVAEPAQLLEDPDQRQPLARRLPPRSSNSSRSRSPCQAPSFGRGCTARSYSNDVAPDRRTFRTVFRDTFSSRTISLIDLPLTRCSRLIRPIVSTTSIPRHPLGIQSGSACLPS